tara:strand:- start:148 stop:456 length:309 start_codon:yes stop_codon:yes gene_type:complete
MQTDDLLKLEFFDSNGNIDQELCLRKIQNTDYYIEDDDSVLYNKFGEVMGEIFPFGNLLNPYKPLQKKISLSNTSITLLKKLPLVDDVISKICQYCTRYVYI